MVLVKHHEKTFLGNKRKYSQSENKPFLLGSTGFGLENGKIF